MVHSSGHKLLHWLKRSPDSGSQWLEQVLAEPQVAKVKQNTTLFSYLIRSFNALLEGPSPPPELLGSDTDDGMSDVGSEDGDAASTFFSNMPAYIMEKYISPHIQDFVAHEVDTHIAPVLRTTCVQVTLGCIGMEIGKQVLRRTVGKLPVLGKGLCWVTRVAMPTPVYGTAIGLYVAFRKLSKARVKEAARQVTSSGAKTPRGKNAPKNAAWSKPVVKPGAPASKAPPGRGGSAPTKTPPPTPKPGSAAAAAAPSRWGGSSPGRAKGDPPVSSPGSPKQAAPPSPSQRSSTPSGRSASPFSPPASMPSLSTILATAYNSLPSLPSLPTLPALPKSMLLSRGTSPARTASAAAGPTGEPADYRPASSIKIPSSLPPVHPVLPPLNTGQLHHTHHHAAAHRGGAGTHVGGALGAEPSRLSRLSRPSSPTVSRSPSPPSASHARTVSGRGSPFSPGRTLTHTQSIGRSSFEARAAVYETQHDRPPSPDPCGHSVTSCNRLGCTTHPHPCSYLPDPGRAVNPLRQRSRCGSPAHGAGVTAVPLINPDTPTTPGSSKLAAWKLGDEGYLWGGSGAAAAGASSGAASPKSPGSRLHGWGLFNLDAGDGGDGGGGGGGGAAAAPAAALSGRPSTSRHTRTRSLEAAAVAANLIAGRPCCPAPTSTPAMSESGHNNVGDAVQCTLARAAALATNPGSDPPCALPSPFMTAAGGAGGADGPAAAANTSVRTIFKWGTDDHGHLHVAINLRPSPPPSPKSSATQIPSPSLSPRTSPPRTSQPPTSFPCASQPMPQLPSPSHTPRTPSPDPRPTSRPNSASNNAPHPTKAAPTRDAAHSAASPAPTTTSPSPTGPHPPHHPQPPLDLQQLPQLSSSIPIPFSAAAKQASRSLSLSPSPCSRSLSGSPQAHVTVSPLLHHGMISLLGAALDEDQLELEGGQVTTSDAMALHAAATAIAAGPTSFAPASLEEMLARRAGSAAGMGVGMGTGAGLHRFPASQLQPHLPSPPSFSGGVEVARQGSLFESWLIKPSDA